MALLVANTAGALENAGVGAVGLVVALFTAVETGAATLAWFGAFTGKMTWLATALWKILC
jgi:hypothetical protein